MNQFHQETNDELKCDNSVTITKNDMPYRQSEHDQMDDIIRRINAIRVTQNSPISDGEKHHFFSHDKTSSPAELADESFSLMSEDMGVMSQAKILRLEDKLIFSNITLDKTVLRRGSLPELNGKKSSIKPTFQERAWSVIKRDSWLDKIYLANTKIHHVYSPEHLHTTLTGLAIKQEENGTIQRTNSQLSNIQEENAQYCDKLKAISKRLHDCRRYIKTQKGRREEIKNKFARETKLLKALGDSTTKLVRDIEECDYKMLHDRYRLENIEKQIKSSKQFPEELTGKIKDLKLYMQSNKSLIRDEKKKLKKLENEMHEEGRKIKSANELLEPTDVQLKIVEIESELASSKVDQLNKVLSEIDENIKTKENFDMKTTTNDQPISQNSLDSSMEFPPSFNGSYEYNNGKIQIDDWKSDAWDKQSLDISEGSLFKLDVPKQIPVNNPSINSLPESKTRSLLWNSPKMKKQMEKYTPHFVKNVRKAFSSDINRNISEKDHIIKYEYNTATGKTKKVVREIPRKSKGKIVPGEDDERVISYEYHTKPKKKTNVKKRNIPKISSSAVDIGTQTESLGKMITAHSKTHDSDVKLLHRDQTSKIVEKADDLSEAEEQSCKFPFFLTRSSTNDSLFDFFNSRRDSSERNKQSVSNDNQKKDDGCVYL